MRLRHFCFHPGDAPRRTMLPVRLRRWPRGDWRTPDGRQYNGPQAESGWPELRPADTTTGLRVKQFSFGALGA
jgi:hypothetical protein